MLGAKLAMCASITIAASLMCVSELSVRECVFCVVGCGAVLVAVFAYVCCGVSVVFCCSCLFLSTFL